MWFRNSVPKPKGGVGTVPTTYVKNRTVSHTPVGGGCISGFTDPNHHPSPGVGSAMQ